MPLTLPANPVPKAQWRTFYTMPKRVLQGLQPQFDEFEAWCKAPIQLDRPTGKISDATFKSVMSSVKLFLGFSYKYLDCNQADLGLLKLLDLRAFASFMAFKVDRRGSITSMKQLISHARKVLSYLPTLSPSLTQQTAMFTRCARAVQWLERLGRQLTASIHKRAVDIGGLQATNQWMEALQLVGMIDTYCKATLGDMPSRGECDFKQARPLHDACLLSTCFGHLPPIRLMCVRSIQVPSSVGCLTEECKDAHCQGNRLVLLPGGKLGMSLCHYKVHKK